MNGVQNPPIDDTDLQGCEKCGKRVPVEDAVCMVDCYYCQTCTAEFEAVFHACAHAWKPYVTEFGPGKYCPKCNGFVEDEGAQ